MLHYANDDHPVLPVHDSFIMHYAYGELGELEEEMRRSFYGHFKKDINVKSEIGIMGYDTDGCLYRLTNLMGD